MKNLDKVTLVIVDTYRVGRALYSLKKSLLQVNPAKTIFFTDIEMDCGEGIEIVKIPPINSKQEYSAWIMKELWKHIETEFVLITQWDSWVLDGDRWNDEFYEYDYMASPWIFEHGRNIGNGGFCLKSKRLCEILGTDPLVQVLHPEDQSLGILYRGHLEQVHGIKFPSEELADTFAYELKCPAVPTFGFHSFFHPPHQKMVVINRQAAMGDVVQVEPVLYYFFKKGYKVVLDTLPQFHNLFIQHYFKVHRPEEVDQRVLATAKKYDLDFSYESKPKQLHLKTYFEYCEVPEKEMILRNPILHLNIEKSAGTKLFKKYCVLHLSVRGQPSRNIQGNINWEEVVKHLNKKGYTVIQVGGSPLEDVKGAVQMMTPGEPFLMWVIREADLMVGVDSGPSNIAVAFNVPAIIFAGSVDLNYIHADLSNICIIENEPNCGNEKCWHSAVSCEGVPCVIDKENPPCVNFQHKEVMSKISHFVNKLHANNS
jgi:ADP-heptose:LPS heptosyltransferase